jgi:phosphoglycerate dehydrogenase-like enzyme
MSLSRSPVSPDTRSSRQAVGVALTLRERRLFFAESSFAFPAPNLVRVIWPDDKDLTDAQWKNFLQRHAPTILLTGWNTPPLPLAWLEAPDCPLRYVCHLTGSVRRAVPRSFVARGGLVTNWGTFAGRFAAEHALLLALAALRNLGSWRPFIAQPIAVRASESIGTRTLYNRKVGIHGFGSIARALITLLQPFGVTVHVYSAGVPEPLLQREGVVACGSLEELFLRSEILFECEALTPTSEMSVTAATLAALPDGAVFVNVGRGRVVDEAALVREAASGRIRVAVDVLADDMTDATALLLVPDAILSPHIAGPSHDQYRRCGERALQNIGRYVNGESPLSRVTLEIYDRST